MTKKLFSAPFIIFMICSFHPYYSFHFLLADAAQLAMRQRLHMDKFNDFLQ